MQPEYFKYTDEEFMFALAKEYNIRLEELENYKISRIGIMGLILQKNNFIQWWNLKKTNEE